MALDSRWLRGIDPADHEKYRQAILNDTFVLGKLLEILNKEYGSLENEMESDSQFDNPNWAHKMAYRNGEKARLRKTIALLNFLKD